MSLVTNNYLSVPPAGSQETTATSPPTNLKRSGSERLRDGAKNILRRVESIKSRRKKKKNREGVIISGPVHLDIMQLHEKFQNMSTKDIKTCRSSTTSPLTGSPVNTSPAPLFLFADPKICPTADGLSSATMFGHHLTPYRQGHPASRTSPLHFFTPKVNSAKNASTTTTGSSQRKQAIGGDDSSSLCSEVSLDSSNESAEKKLSPIGRHFHSNSSSNNNKKQEEDVGALSDTEAFHVRQKKRTTKSQKANTIVRGGVGGGSLNLGRDSNRYRESLKTRRIFRSRSAVRHHDNNNTPQDASFLRASSSANNKNSSVVRWHSFRATTNTKRDFNDGSGEGVSLCKLSCGQIEKLRKLALVTLTGYMERYVHLCN